MVNDNVGKLLDLAPDVVKGHGAYKELTGGGASKMGEGGWRNMVNRYYDTSTDAEGKAMVSAEEKAQIKAIAESAQSNPLFATDMTEAKYGFATQITGKNKAGETVVEAPVPTQSDKDYAGRLPDKGPDQEHYNQNKKY